MFKFLASDLSIKIWDSRDGTLIQTLNGHRKGISDVSWSPNNCLLVSASNDQMLRVWRLSSV